MKKIQRGCPPYEGNEPYLYFCFAEKDRDAVFPLLEHLYLRGVRIWYNVEKTDNIRKLNRQQERMNQAALLIIYLTENSRNDERVKNSLLFYQNGKPVIGIDTDDGDNELAFGMTARAQHIDGRKGRSPEELEADLIRTEGFSHELIGEPLNRMKLLLKKAFRVVVAAVLVALVAVTIIIGRQQWGWFPPPPTPSPTPTATPTPSPTPVAEALLVQNYGFTYSDLESIEVVIYVGDKLKYFKRYNEDPVKYTSYIDKFVVYREDQNNPGRYKAYYKADGSEISKDYRWDDLSYLSLMPNLKTICIFETEIAEMPDLSALQNLVTVEIQNSKVPDLDWLSGSSVKRFIYLHEMPNGLSLSPLNGCPQLTEVELDFSGTGSVNMTDFAPPNLKTLRMTGGDMLNKLQINHLEDCTKLQEVTLENLPLKDLSSLEGANRMGSLTLRNCSLNC